MPPPSGCAKDLRRRSTEPRRKSTEPRRPAKPPKLPRRPAPRAAWKCLLVPPSKVADASTRQD